MKKVQAFLYANRHFVMTLLFAAAMLTAGSAFGFDLNPASNPFGTRGDQAIGGFGANVLTIVNAVGFYGGIVFVFITGYKIATSQPWFGPAAGAVIGLGGWSLIGAIAYQAGSNQAFQIPLVT